MNKKTAILLCVLLAVCLGAFAFVAFSMLRGERPESGKTAPVEVRSAIPVIPDVDVAPLEENKMDAYSKGDGSEDKYADMWASLASDDVNKDVRRDRQNDDLRSSLVGQGSSVYDDPAPAPRRSASTSRPAPAPKQQPVTVEEQPVEDTPQEAPAVRKVSPEPEGVMHGWDGAPSVDENVVWDDDSDRLIKCAFVNDDKVKSGQRVFVRILEPMYVDGLVVPANTYLAATVTISSRLEVNITGFQMNGKLYTVRYSGYDPEDGGKGLYCPTVDDSQKRSARNSGISLGSSLASGVVGATVAGQVARTAIATGSSIVQMSSNGNNVSVKSGYVFYLKREKQGY